MKHLIIIGVGGFGRQVYWDAQNSLGYGAEWNLKGFLDGDVRLPDEEYEKLKLPVVGDINSYQPQDDDCFICAIANSVVRKRLTDIIQELKLPTGKTCTFPIVIHLSATSIIKPQTFVVHYAYIPVVC